MLARIFTILSISMLFSSLCLAAIYKWEDADGKIHYSAQKPPAVQAKKMKVPSKTPENTSTYKRPSLENKDDAKQDGEPAAEQKQPELSKDQQQEACNSARKALQAINSRGRTKLRDKDGNIRYMSDEERQGRIKREQDRVNKYCK